MQVTLERVRAGDPDPACLECGGILKSDTISFGQSLIPEVIDRAMTVAEESDVLLAVGSTLSVGPANQVVPRARATGSRVIILNGEPTAMDTYAHLRLQGSITPTLQAIVRNAGFTTLDS
jgi:NAD-dependent deacetylase